MTKPKRPAAARPAPRFIPIILGVIAFLLAVRLILAILPFPELESFLSRPYGRLVTDRYGRFLRLESLENGLKREWADLSAFPDPVIRVFVRAEDKRFFWHPGVDPAAVFRSALRNSEAGRVVSGASTITMQVARLVCPHGPGLAGKIFEAFTAVRIEGKLGKRRILELYLNSIPFGNNIEGLPAMSRMRYGRSVSELDDARAALLAVIPRRPALYDPALNPERALSAALELSRSTNLGLDPQALSIAASDARMDAEEWEAPHFVNRILEEVPNSGRGPVTTSIDLDLQRYAQERLAAEVELLRENRVSTGAILAMDNASGEILVYVGSRSWDDPSGGQIDAVRILNQPGSCLKPFLYALALERGFLPNSVLPDLPTIFGSEEAYIPSNFNQRFNGPVRLRVALASSLNVPAVYILERLSVGAFEDSLIDLGFDSVARTKGSHGTGLALGNAEVSLEELTRAFSVFPNRGFLVPLRLVRSEKMPLKTEKLSSYTAWIIADILSDKASRFVGFGPAVTMQTNFPAIFKTGTANQFQHIWALAASSRFTVGVWMGNVTYESVIGKTGSSIPARLANQVLTALENEVPFDRNVSVAGDQPPSVSAVELCTLSGLRATENCRSRYLEYLPSNRLPEECDWHRGDELVYPAEYRFWLAERDRVGRAATGKEKKETASIRRPAEGALFYLDPSLPKTDQAVRLETAGFGDDALVYMDDELLGSLNPAGVLLLPLIRGRHAIRVEDSQGTTDFVSILVR